MTKWCPFARAPLATAAGEVVNGASVVYRRASGGPDAASLCIASACMAWRLNEAPRETLRNFKDAPTVQPRPGMGPHIYLHGWQYSHTDQDHDGRKFDLLHRVAADDAVHGYCGLAGSPS